MGKDLAILTAVGVALSVAIWGGAFYLAAASCASKAEKMGFQHDWGVMQGCMIEPKPGQWVPLKNYRGL